MSNDELREQILKACSDLGLSTSDIIDAATLSMRLFDVIRFETRSYTKERSLRIGKSALFLALQVSESLYPSTSTSPRTEDNPK